MKHASKSVHIIPKARLSAYILIILKTSANFSISSKVRLLTIGIMFLVILYTVGHKSK